MSLMKSSLSQLQPIIPTCSPNIQQRSVIRWNDLPDDILEYIFYLVSAHSSHPGFTSLLTVIQLSHINHQSRQCLDISPRCPLWMNLIFDCRNVSLESLSHWPLAQLTYLDAHDSLFDNHQLHVLLDKAPLLHTLHVAGCPYLDLFQCVQDMETMSASKADFPHLQRFYFFESGQKRIPEDAYARMWHAHWKTPLVGLVKRLNILFQSLIMDVFACRECQDYVFFGSPPTVACSDCQALVTLDLCLACESMGIVCLNCHNEILN